MDVAHKLRAAWLLENLVTRHMVRMDNGGLAFSFLQLYVLVTWVICLKNDSKGCYLG